MIEPMRYGAKPSQSELDPYQHPRQLELNLPDPVVAAYSDRCFGGKWVVIDRPGYFGRHREERHEQFNRQYGQFGWRLAWLVDDLVYSFEMAVMLYEDSYRRFLTAEPAVRYQLVNEASNVYDDAQTNVLSGLDYGEQETGRTHLQDIAIRRVLVSLGYWFKGDTLIRIRDKDGSHPLSMELSPGRVPFSQPELIKKPQLEGWWQPNSVESFYQSNKVLLASFFTLSSWD